MSTILSRHWWAFAIRGVLALVIGVLALLAPGPTLVALIALFAAYAVVDGVFAIAAGLGAPSGPRWMLVLGGLAGLAIGAITFVAPGITALALLTIVAVWAIVTGVAEIVAAIRLRAVIDREWLLILSGVVSTLFGAFLLISPGTGILAIIWLIGYYAIFAGVMYLGLAFRLRGKANQAGEGIRGRNPLPQ